MVCRLRVVTIKLLKRDNPGLEAGTELDGLGVDVGSWGWSTGALWAVWERVNLLSNAVPPEIGLAMNKKHTKRGRKREKREGRRDTLGTALTSKQLTSSLFHSTPLLLPNEDRSRNPCSEARSNWFYSSILGVQKSLTHENLPFVCTSLTQNNLCHNSSMFWLWMKVHAFCLGI